MDARPLLSFLKVRGAGAAAGFTLAGWLYLIVSAPTTDIPFGQRSVPSPLIWPAAAAISTMLVCRSQLVAWELPAGRRLWPYRLSVVGAVVLTNLTAASALLPSFAAVPLLTWFAALQALAMGCTIVLGDQAWLPVTAVILVAVFELAQDGSWLFNAVATAGAPSLAVAAGSALVLAGLAATDRAQRVSARRR